ncbi:MAG: bifunctional riboflavin kinase/FAD synthetase [Bacteroidia bacterium]|nr:bifunctional riboflavin kinase/FAD synthetase [Bacteroidia bacterium]
MKVYRHYNEFVSHNNAVVTTGTFDGVHNGHLQIIHRLNIVAKAIGGESVIFTFDPHPRRVLQPHDNDLLELNTLNEKIELLRQAGVQHLIIQPFTEEFSRISSLDFIRKIIVGQLGTKRLVIGYDHRFGRNREGAFEHLKEFGPVYGFEVEELSAQLTDDVTVSSTKIRKALLAGEITNANNYLGYTYFATGTVVTGAQLGRTIGFPTANIVLDYIHKLIPCNGVYAVQARHNSVLYNGVCNIGTRPTVDGTTRKIEVHLFDFNVSIYNEKLQIYFVAKIRNEQKFESIDALKVQIACDAAVAKKLLLGYGSPHL